LIVKVARHLIETSALCRRRIGRYVNDYIGPGYLGLVRARQAYRPGRGASFTTYAFVVIRHYMMLEAYNSGLVRVPVYLANDARRLAEGQPPTATARRRADPRTLQAAGVAFTCEYRPVLEGYAEESGLVEESRVAEVDEREAYQYLSAVLDRAIDQLDRLSKRVIRRHYGLRGLTPQTLADVGRSLSLSKQQVHVLKRRALAQLRTLLDESLFD
jgi:RNA polymerase sigma factor (sigma-70 family)